MKPAYIDAWLKDEARRHPMRNPIEDPDKIPCDIPLWQMLLSFTAVLLFFTAEAWVVCLIWMHLRR